VTLSATRTPGHRSARIVAELSEPVITNDLLLHLDGPLAYAAYRELGPDARDALPRPDDAWLEDLPIPLTRWFCPSDGTESHPRLQEDGLLWGWCASNVIGDVVFAKTELRKRVPAAEHARYTRSPSAALSSGALKAYDLTLRAVCATRLSWRIHGDPDAVVALLRRHVWAIGKKRGLGNGRVREWRAEEVAETGSDWALRDGDRPLRVLPASSGLRGPRSLLAIRPAYHHRSRRCAAIRPLTLRPRST